MASLSFVEAYVEGRNPWDRRKLGWKLRLGRFCLPAYHFHLFFLTLPLLLALPLAVAGWSLPLFGLLLSAYLSGIVIEDVLWYVVNPVVSWKEFGPEFVDYHPWVRVGPWSIPVGHVFLLCTAAGVYLALV